MRVLLLAVLLFFCSHSADAGLSCALNKNDKSHVYYGCKKNGKGEIECFGNIIGIAGEYQLFDCSSIMGDLKEPIPFIDKLPRDKTGGEIW